jgi:PA14 domain-containing protein
MRRRTRALVLLGSLGGAPACAPDESSIGGLFRADPGLVAEYFDARDFQQPSGQQPSGVYRDADIDFQGWQLNELVQARGHAARSMSIRWSGQIRFAHAETYTLGFDLQGRVRIWIDGALVVDDWVDSGVLRRARGTLGVLDPAWHDLRIDFDQQDGPMTARLRWQSPSQADAVVPASALRHLEP